MKNELWAITPLDGRYANKLSLLNSVVSEGALIRYRARVEALWLLHLAEQPEIAQQLKMTPELQAVLERIAEGIDDEACTQVKRIEEKTNHDVKAVEYFLRDQLRLKGASDSILSFIHFACTSEDINNLAYALMLDEARKTCLLPVVNSLLVSLQQQIKSYSDLPMLSRTHGQSASPTTLGKELAVFYYRLRRQVAKLEGLDLDGKMSGAVGNYNAHFSSYPNLDWLNIAKDFVENKLDLSWNPLTTQIENHDSVAEYCDIVRRINTVSIGLCRDVWGYISLGYFKQELKDGEVGSSTMPHKVNPIDFENAEGNFGLSSALASHFSEKLPISRWQRDLSDSTVLRAIGSMVGHTFLAMQSLLKGFGKLAVNEEAMSRDLDESWEVLGEAVQTVMRKYGVVDAYERLKQITRGRAVCKAVIHEAIDTCEELPNSVKADLMKLTPRSYIGIADVLAIRFLDTGEKS
ncbi:MAG: adenylosuccinate lyase [Bdellovibrionota bacterium]